MKHMIARREALFFAALLTFLGTHIFLTTPASAQVVIDGELTHMYEGEPGETYQGSIVIRNISDTAQEMKVYQTNTFLPM